MGIILREIKTNLLFPMGMTESFLTGCVAMFVAEAVLGLFTAFAIPALDYVTFYAQLIMKRNNNIYKINQPVDEGQIKRELIVAGIAVFVIAFINAPIHYSLEAGYAKIYQDFDYFNNIWLSTGYWVFQILFFFILSDFCIYWIHVGLHSDLLYRPLHKLHHSFVFPSPFTAFAFHPLDAWAQSWPYWFTPYIIPMHKLTHLILLVAVTVWTTSIHDRITFTDWQIVNGAGHHYVHHRDFKYNYGQYFTWCDRLFGTYKDPVEPTTTLENGKKKQKTN